MRGDFTCKIFFDLPIFHLSLDCAFTGQAATGYRPVLCYLVNNFSAESFNPRRPEGENAPQ